MKQKNNGYKLFIVRTYVKAKNVSDALRRAKKQIPDDVYVSDDWKEGKLKTFESAMGFRVIPTHEDDDE
jgi:hypothetical protein